MNEISAGNEHSFHEIRYAENAINQTMNSTLNHESSFVLPPFRKVSGMKMRRNAFLRRSIDDNDIMENTQNEISMALKETKKIYRKIRDDELEKQKKLEEKRKKRYLREKVDHSKHIHLHHSFSQNSSPITTPLKPEHYQDQQLSHQQSFLEIETPNSSPNKPTTPKKTLHDYQILVSKKLNNNLFGGKLKSSNEKELTQSLSSQLDRTSSRLSSTSNSAMKSQRQNSISLPNSIHSSKISLQSTKEVFVPINQKNNLFPNVQKKTSILN